MQAARSTNHFGLRLYHQQAATPGNVFVSPYSVAFALAMLRAGARGATAHELDVVLAAEGLDLPTAHRELRAALRPRHLEYLEDEDGRPAPSFTLALASRIWVRAGLQLEPDFASIEEHAYGAAACSADFGRADELRAAIHAWVAERTQGRITELLPPGMPDAATSMLLANAIWFRARWAEEFARHATRDEPFTRLDGTRKDVPMMQLEHDLRYAQLETAQLLALPYLGGDTELWLLLPAPAEAQPDAAVRLAALEAELEAEQLAAWDAALASTRVRLRLPRFGIARAADLAELLRALGLEAAFDAAAADFGGITKVEPLVLGPVLHRSWLAIDEEGTEAAAATAAAMLTGSAFEPEPPEPVAFDADRPFVFAIRHVASGTLLFVGRLVDPTAATD